MKTFLTLLTLIFISGCASSPLESGTAALQKGDLVSAEKLLNQSISANENLAESWNNLGVVYQRQGDRQRAINAYTIGARYGNPLSQKNLAALNAPIPSADLVQRQSNSNAGLKAFAEIVGGTISARQQEDSRSINVYQMPDTSSRSKPNPLMMEVPKSYNCRNTGPGMSTCTER